MEIQHGWETPSHLCPGFASTEGRLEVVSRDNRKRLGPPVRADAGRMFRVMQRESVRNTQLVGVNSVLSATT